jgi:hypothetical protein
MPLYSVIRKSDQVEVSRYVAMRVIDDDYPLVEFDHTEIPDETPSPPAQATRRITKFAFRNRFTLAEKVAIEIASLDNPTADMQQRSLAAALRASQNDMAVATFVDLDFPATRQGVQMLEQHGLLALGRAAEILDAEIADEERWNG